MLIFQLQVEFFDVAGRILKLVDRKGIEPLTLTCKTSVFPLALTAHKSIAGVLASDTMSPALSRSLKNFCP